MTARGAADPRTLTHYEPTETASEIGTKAGASFHDASPARFSNSGLPVAKELSSRYDKGTPDCNERTGQGNWMASELHQTRQEIQRLEFHHFIAAPDSPLAKAADSQPIGLDPAAFGGNFPRAVDRGVS